MEGGGGRGAATCLLQEGGPHPTQAQLAVPRALFFITTPTGAPLVKFLLALPGGGDASSKAESTTQGEPEG